MSAFASNIKYGNEAASEAEVDKQPESHKRSVSEKPKASTLNYQVVPTSPAVKGLAIACHRGKADIFIFDDRFLPGLKTDAALRKL